jgi:putative FmdB family regulatory protein
MPIYEYECPKCGKFDALQGINDKPLKANPECKAKDCPKKAVKLMSSTSFQLVGSGWYKSDYGSSGTAGTETKKKTDKKADSKKGGGGGCGSGCSCH